MKLAQITIAVIIIALLCIIVSALPNLDHLIEDDCRECHGDENGNTSIMHHNTINKTDQDPNCKTCHSDIGNPYEETKDFRRCDTCHLEFDHHDNAQGSCGDCHEDKQKKKGQKKGPKR